MIFISGKKKIKLGKLIAATKHIAVHTIHANLWIMYREVTEER